MFVAFYQDVEDPIVFSSFKDRLSHLQVSHNSPYAIAIAYFTLYLITFTFSVLRVLLLFIYGFRELKIIGFVSVNLVYMDGDYLHV